MSIQDLIASVGDRLTPTERRIARVVVEDPTRVAFGAVSDLAAQARTSRPSIVRFARKLGFDGYPDFQGWVQEHVARRVAAGPDALHPSRAGSPGHRIRQPHGEPASMRALAVSAVEHAFSALSEERLAALALPLAKAENVWIISGETSMAGAHVLHSGLAMIRPAVHLVDEHAAARQLSGAGPADAAAVFDFARYRRHAVTIARALADEGVPIVAVTDGPLSPLAALTAAWCELRIPALGPFDSALPAVTAAELLVARVVSELGDAARDRIDRLEKLWQTSGTYLDYRPRDSRSE